MRYNRSVKTHIVPLIARILFIICVPLFLLTLCVSVAANCGALYHHSFTTYGISQVTGITLQELDKAADGLIKYFNSGEKSIDVTVIKDGKSFTLFNEREVGHLEDVKSLFQLGYGVLLGTFLYGVFFILASVFWWKDRRNIGLGLLWGGGLSLAVMLALGITIAVDFNGFFLRFHMLSFANDLWLLDPSHDYLIVMFPQGFWFDAALYIALAALAGAVITGLAGWLILRKNAVRDSRAGALRAD